MNKRIIRSHFKNNQKKGSWYFICVRGEQGGSSYARALSVQQCGVGEDKRDDTHNINSAKMAGKTAQRPAAGSGRYCFLKQLAILNKSEVYCLRLSI